MPGKKKNTPPHDWDSVSTAANGCTHFDFHRRSTKLRCRPYVRQYRGGCLLVFPVTQPKARGKTLPLSDEKLFQKRLYYGVI